MSNTDDMKEKLSALVDNELDDINERHVMMALKENAELRDTWERYHLARSAMRQDVDIILPPDVSARVAAYIEMVPATVASFRNRSFTRLIGTLAIAASVAAIAIVGVQWLNHPAAESVPAIASVEPTPENIIRAGTTRWDVKAPESESTLNAFLVEHNEFASSSGIGGMMPYVRVVGYDNPK